MGKKRKAQASNTLKPGVAKTKHDIEDRFDDSEDEFYAGRNKILVDEEPAAKWRRRIIEQEKDIEASDEEVFEEPESDDDDLSNPSEGEDDEEDEMNWGTTKADYFKTDVIETEADAIDEEKEAKRLLQKQLKGMTVEDFGFDESAWTQIDTKKVEAGPVVEKLPKTRIPSGANEKTVTSLLHSRYPEFEPLANDFVELQHVWTRLQQSKGRVQIGITIQTKIRALTAYLGAIAMYFAVLASTVDTTADENMITSYPPSDLKEHAVIGNLISTRRLWNTVKGAEEVGVVSELKFSPELPTKPQTEEKKEKERKITSKRRSLSPESPEEKLELEPVARKKPLDLQMLLAQSATIQQTADSDFGDEGPLTAEQAEEKARKKKSLRFYTSQIAQKANRRGAASREAGGDDDVPRKERLRDKQERLFKEAEKRGKEAVTAGEELGGDSDDDVGSMQDDAYYQSLVAGSKRKKADKQAKAEAYAEAARQGGQVYEEEQIGTDGKRRITYAIEKNKGLAPKRNKDVRNPRVKKRKKYDEKMKKLGSIRQVYKGGQKGAYGGESTGIKTNVIKSIKL